MADHMTPPTSAVFSDLSREELGRIANWTLLATVVNYGHWYVIDVHDATQPWLSDIQRDAVEEAVIRWFTNEDGTCSVGDPTAPVGAITYHAPWPLAPILIRVRRLPDEEGPFFMTAQMDPHIRH